MIPKMEPEREFSRGTITSFDISDIDDLIRTKKDLKVSNLPYGVFCQRCDGRRNPLMGIDRVKGIAKIAEFLPRVSAEGDRGPNKDSIFAALVPAVYEKMLDHISNRASKKIRLRFSRNSKRAGASGGCTFGDYSLSGKLTKQLGKPISGPTVNQ